MDKVEKYEVTGTRMDMLDKYIQSKGLTLYAKVYRDYASQIDNTPEIFISEANSIWSTVINYCGCFYAGGCLEIFTKENEIEFVLFHLREGMHFIPKFDADALLGIV